ncbi:MAG: NAD(P)H-dependent oxidoreductase [Rubrivivax sp.]
MLVFAGSTRAGSWNRKIARVCAAMAREAGAEVTHIELADYDLPLYNADLEARGTPEASLRLKALFHAHDAFIVCSPEYNAGLPALTKNTLDWVSSPVPGHPLWADGLRPFRGKVAAMLSASPGALGGVRSLAQLTALLFNLQCWLVPQPYALARAHEAFDAAGDLMREDARAAVRDLVARTCWAARRLRAGAGIS